MEIYSLKEKDDGSVDLLETRPVVVGTFLSRELADRVIAFLHSPPTVRHAATSIMQAKGKDAEQLEAATESVAKAIECAITSFDEIIAAPDAGAVAKVVTQNDQQPIPAPANAAPAPEDWAGAFQAVKNGANMDEVAATLGVSFTQLRARYAAWRRGQKAARGDDIAKESCRMCGKQFAASADSDGLCSRCRHG
jgi:hypothetical protein